MTNTPPMPRPDGAVFISYHQRSGAQEAEFVETYLRAGGIVPWRDIRDLESGAVTRSVQKAFDEGLSGAVLLVSDGIQDSDFVPKEELPLILDVDEASDGYFQFHIVNTIRRDDGMDVTAPDARLQPKCPRPAKLADRLQHALLRAAPPVNQLDAMLKDLLKRRIEHWRVRGNGPLRVGLQTRPAPTHQPASPLTPDTGDLHIRLRQDVASQIPEELDLRCLQKTLPVLVDTIFEMRVESICFSGGCHPSVAWALGTGIPKSRGRIESFVWQDVDGNDWSSAATTREVRTTVRYRVVDPSKRREDRVLETQSGGDLRAALRLPDGNTEHADVVVVLALAGFKRDPVIELAQRLGSAPVVVIEFSGPLNEHGQQVIPSEEGQALAVRIGQALRELGDGVRIHLAASIPVALVTLAARECNTVCVDFYELASSGVGVREYIRVMRMEAGNGRPIVGVFGQAMPQVDEVRTLTNLTPHAVTYIPAAEAAHTWFSPKSDAEWVRRREDSEQLPTLRVDGQEVPLTRVRQGGVAPWPPMIPGVGYIVPRISAEAARRPDFLFPYGEVRSETGTIIGCRGLGCFESSTDRCLQYMEWLDPIPE